jgi:hypothetical protein
VRADGIAERRGDPVHVDRGLRFNRGTRTWEHSANLDPDGHPALRDDLVDRVSHRVRDGKPDDDAVAVTDDLGYYAVLVTDHVDNADIESLNVAVVDSERHGTDQSLPDGDRFRNR